MRLAIRLLTLGDLPPASGILQDAFGTPRRNETDLRRYLEMQPDGWLLASVDGVPVGVVGAVDYGRFAYIGMMGVRRDHQGRGIARALFRGLIERLDAQASPALLLDATSAGEGLYRSFDFTAIAETAAYELTPSSRPPPPTLRPVHLEPEDLAALARFDAPIFGASRHAHLVRFVEDFPERILIARDGNGISGFLIAQPTRIGPWVAQRTDVAEALLRSALALPYEGAPNVLVGSENAAGNTLLSRYGFRRGLITRHMIRGTLSAPRRRDLIYGQASFAIG